MSFVQTNGVQVLNKKLSKLGFVRLMDFWDYYPIFNPKIPLNPTYPNSDKIKPNINLS